MFGRIRATYARANHWVNAKRGRAQMIVQVSVAINIVLMMVILRNRTVNQSINRKSMTGDMGLLSEDAETRDRLHQQMADFVTVTQLRKEELRAIKQEEIRALNQSTNQAPDESVNLPINQSTNQSVDPSVDDRFHRIDQSSEDSVSRTYVIDGREKHVTFVKNRPHIYPTGQSIDQSTKPTGQSIDQSVDQSIKPQIDESTIPTRFMDDIQFQQQ